MRLLDPVVALLGGHLVGVNAHEAGSRGGAADELGSHVGKEPPDAHSGGLEDGVLHGDGESDGGVHDTAGDASRSVAADDDAEADGQTVEVLEGLLVGRDSEHAIAQNESEHGLSKEDTPPGEGDGVSVLDGGVDVGAEEDLLVELVADPAGADARGEATTELGDDVVDGINGRDLVAAAASDGGGDGGVEVGTGNAADTVDGAHEGAGTGDDAVLGGEGSQLVATDGQAKEEGANELGAELGAESAWDTAELLGADHAVENGSKASAGKLTEKVPERPAETLGDGGQIVAESDSGVKASTRDGTDGVRTNNDREANAETVEFVALVSLGKSAIQHAENEESGEEHLREDGLEAAERSDGVHVEGLVDEGAIAASGGEATENLRNDVAGHVLGGEIRFAQSNTDGHGGIEMTTRDTTESVNEDHQRGSDGEGGQSWVTDQRIESNHKREEECTEEFGSILSGGSSHD